MNKEDMISILNQHGIDALYAVIEDELDKQTEDIVKQQSTYDPLMDREYNI